MQVLKFGGAALRDGPAVRHATEIVRRHGGERPLVVVSAHEGVTKLLEHAVDEALQGRLDWDRLRVRHRTILRQLELPGDLLDRHLFELRAMLESLRGDGRADHRARDFVLSFGERMSARVFAAVLRRAGSPATPLDAYDLGLVSSAGLLREPDRLPAAVGESLRCVPGIPVVTGFLALDVAGHLTTLGRNGSDLSAVWFAEVVAAEEVQLWKTVPGVLTADPELVSRARLVPELGWLEAAEMATHGAEIVHPGALEVACRARLCLRVLDVGRPDEPGTRIEGEDWVGSLRGIAHRPSVALFDKALDLRRDRGSQVAAIFGALADARLEPFLSNVTGSRVEVLVPDEPRLPAIAEEGLGGAHLERGLASVAIVGRGAGADAALRSTVEREAERLGVRARPAPGGGSPASQAFLVDRTALAPLVAELHAILFEPETARRAT